MQLRPPPIGHPPLVWTYGVVAFSFDASRRHSARPAKSKSPPPFCVESCAPHDPCSGQPPLLESGTKLAKKKWKRVGPSPIAILDARNNCGMKIEMMGQGKKKGVTSALKERHQPLLPMYFVSMTRPRQHWCKLLWAGLALCAIQSATGPSGVCAPTFSICSRSTPGGLQILWCRKGTSCRCTFTLVSKDADCCLKSRQCSWPYRLFFANWFDAVLGLRQESASFETGINTILCTIKPRVHSL